LSRFDAIAGRTVWSRDLSLHAVLWWLLAVLIVGLSAALFWALVTPVAPLGNWKPVGVTVLSPKARADLFSSFDPFNRSPSISSPGAKESGAITSLALTLFATRSAPGGGGSAIIAGADGVQQVYRNGTEVSPGVTLRAVAFDHVELERNGSRELLYLDQSRPAPDADRLIYSAPAARADRTAHNLTVDAARSGIGFGPRAEGGKIVGLEVLPQGDGNTFRAAGFEPGDVVTMVNGHAVSGSGDMALLAGAMKPGSSISVSVRRSGRDLPLAIPLAP
jgi:general secretion pathway protein C